jgi:hypothetical protein
MTEVSQARERLINALRQYFEADTDAEVELAVLALHKGLEEALRAYLASQGYDEVDYRQLSFPELVDLIRDHTDLFGGDPKLPPLLVSLNTTRIKIAHPGEDKPTPKEIAQDAGQFADLIHRFWPKLFGEVYPAPLSKAPSPEPKQDRPVIQEPPPEPHPAVPEPEAQRVPSPKLWQFLKRLWKDETEPRFQKRLFLKRVMAIVILFALANWCKSGAIYTARWPEPVKYVGVTLFLLAVGLFVWGVLTVWKALRQLRLRGLLIILGIGYVLLIGVSVLTSDSPLPFHRNAWLATRRLVTSSTHRARDIGQALVKATAEFRFAYTGHRRPVRLAGMDPEDSSYLTPIPANQPAKLSLGAQPTITSARAPSVSEKETPAPTKYASGITASPSPAFTFVPAPTETQEHPTIPPLRLPDCPHPQARLTAPKVNQVITDEVQVEGTADIEHFDYYKFEFRREDGDIEDEWHWVESFETPVEEGVLGVWHVSHLPAGIYTFRLTVVNREGNYPFPPCDVKVQITH